MRSYSLNLYFIQTKDVNLIMKCEKKAIIPATLLIMSLFFPYAIGYWQSCSTNCFLECIGTLLLACACLFPKTKASSIIKAVSLVLLVLFNSYLDLFSEVYGTPALRIATFFLCFAAYVWMIIAEFYQGRVFIIIGTGIFAISACSYILPTIFHVSAIIMFSCILKFAAIAILWWQQTSAVLLNKKETAVERALDSQPTLETPSETTEKEFPKMKYCQHCGAQVQEQAVVCVNCGCALTPINQESDVASPGLNVLSFFFPLVGLILYIAYQEKTPVKAKAIGNWAAIGFVTALCLTMLSVIMLKSI